MEYPVIDMKKTGQRIKYLMDLNGLTVRNVQDFLDFSTPRSIYHWFYGRNLPTIDNLYALSELFGMPVDAMLVGNRKYEYVYQRELLLRIVAYARKARDYKLR